MPSLSGLLSGVIPIIAIPVFPARFTLTTWCPMVLALASDPIAYEDLMGTLSSAVIPPFLSLLFIGFRVVGTAEIILCIGYGVWCCSV